MRPNEDGRARGDPGDDEHYTFDLITNVGPAGDQVGARVAKRLGEWVVEYTLVSEDGGPVISDLHVYAGDVNGLDRQPSPVPTGGLSARLLRELRPAEAVRHARSELADRAPADDPLAESVARHGYTYPGLRERRRSGRRSHPPRFYATIAAAYVEALDGGSRQPVKDVADSLGYSPARIRDLLVKARGLGLLTQTRRGRAAGRLTGAARQALEDADDHSRLPANPPQRSVAPGQTKSPKTPSADESGTTRGGPHLDDEINRQLGIDGVSLAPDAVRRRLSRGG